MKQFFEQYGGVALGILALIVLIAMITPVGNIIKTSLQGTVNTFSTKMNLQTDTMSESMNEIMTDIAGYRGTIGSKLSDVQYKYLKDHYSEWHNNNTLLFLGINYFNGNLRFNDLVFYNTNDYFLSLEESPVQTVYRYNVKIIDYDGNQNTGTLHAGHVYNPTYSLRIYNSGNINLPFVNEETRPFFYTDSCETLNLGCEVS